MCVLRACIHLIHISTTNGITFIQISSVVTWSVASNAGAFLSSRTLLKISATVYNRNLTEFTNTSNTLYMSSRFVSLYIYSGYKLINAHFFSFIGFFPEQTIVLTKATSEMYSVRIIIIYLLYIVYMYVYILVYTVPPPTN